MFKPKLVEIVEKEIIVNTGAYTKLKEILTNEAYNRENGHKAVFLNLVFNKVNKTIEKNLLRIFEEDYRLFNFKDNFSNEKIVFTTIQGDFQFDFSEHNSLKQEILDRVVTVNSRYKAILDKLEQQESLDTKGFEYKYSRASVLNKTLDSLLNKAIRYNSFLFENNHYDDRADLDLNVDFQRDIVWTLKQKQDLIISLINDIPIGNFYVNSLNIYSEVREDDSKSLKEYSEIDNVLYDGKQRINAILEFVLGEFSVTIDGEDYFYGNLDFRTKHEITHKTVNVYETEFNNKNDLIDFYILLNKNQTAHNQEDFDKALKFKK